MQTVDDYIDRAKSIKTVAYNSPVVGVYETRLNGFVKANWPIYADQLSLILSPISFVTSTYRPQDEHQKTMDNVIIFLEEIKNEEISTVSAQPLAIEIATLHPEIANGCTKLFSDGSYPEAVEKSFKIVRDRLRTVTGQETITRALGKTDIHFDGAAGESVDHDFQEGVKFLLMSIDFFRNEKAHVPNGNINSPEQAIEYLGMSSIAMRHLDNIQVTSKH